MDVNEYSHCSINIDLSKDELLVFNAALNEVCNGIDMSEFETRVGASREFVMLLLKETGLLLDDMDAWPANSSMR